MQHIEIGRVLLPTQHLTHPKSVKEKKTEQKC